MSDKDIDTLFGCWFILLGTVAFAWLGFIAWAVYALVTR